MVAISGFKRGDTRRYKFTFTKNTGTVLAPVIEPNNITGWILTLTFKLDADTDLDNAATTVKVAITAGDDSGGAALPDDLAGGVMYLTLPSDVSETLQAGEKYDYDFQRTIPGTPPDVRTLNSGRVTVSRDVTRDAL